MEQTAPLNPVALVARMSAARRSDEVVSELRRSFYKTFGKDVSTNMQFVRVNNVRGWNFWQVSRGTQRLYVRVLPTGAKAFYSEIPPLETKRSRRRVSARINNNTARRILTNS